MKKDKISDATLTIVFSALIIFISAATIIKKPQDLSLSEGRELAKFPSASVESLKSGEYFDGIRNFYSDQLAFKSRFADLYASARLALGALELNGMVICQNGALAARQKNVDPEISKKNLAAARKLTDLSSSAILFVVPDSADAFFNFLPPLLSKAVAEKHGSGELDLQFLKKISSAPEKYYYKTDHHWTSDGAYQAYLLICKRLGIEPASIGSFETESVTKSFLGSTYRRSALPASFVTPDEIILYRHPSEHTLRVTDLVSNTELGGIYDLDELSGADPYRVFLGGNHAHISISAKSENKRPKMLVIKDSFANSLIPFLAIHFDLEVVDPRYADSSVAKKISPLSYFDSVLFICSRDTVSSNSSYAFFINSIAGT
ncbi:MAG: hypothetical protein E7642_05685 [Ruminococcaceae bacterium]|nr:hypothetical protein [Oscillospiraceae bacterium]